MLWAGEEGRGAFIALQPLMALWHTLKLWVFLL